MVGMLLFIFVETMLFASFISSYLIISSSASNWPPLGQPRLPILTTGVNTLILLFSGLALVFSYRLFSMEGNTLRVKKLFLAALVLGMTFFSFQGYEWVRLIHFGLTLQSGVYGSFFYLIIGFHGLHVLAASVILALMYRRLHGNRLKRESFAAVLALWLFVVGVWPVLYYLVYIK